MSAHRRIAPASRDATGEPKILLETPRIIKEETSQITRT
jgi:hypothetical protein